jgi:hypothetical protein
LRSLEPPGAVTEEVSAKRPADADDHSNVHRAAKRRAVVSDTSIAPVPVDGPTHRPAPQPDTVVLQPDAVVSEMVAGAAPTPVVTPVAKSKLQQQSKLTQFFGAR